MRVGFGARVAGLMLALALPFSAAAQQSRVYREGGFWVEEVSGSLPAAQRIAVHLPLGSISVQGGDYAVVRYQLKKRVPAEEAVARRQFERFRFTANKSVDTIMLEGHFSGGHFMYGVELVVEVPHAIQLVKAFTHGGNESVSGVDGRVEVSTAGGNIHLDKIAGSVVATSAGGNVDVGSIGGDLTLQTGGGNVRVMSVKGRITTSSGGGNIVIGSAQGVRAETGGGQIEVKHCEGELRANTGGGSLDLGQVAGKAFLQSAGGSIRLSAANGPVVANTGGGTVELFGLMYGAEVLTGAGPITAEFLGSSFEGSSLQTPSGDIVVYLSPGLKATIRAAIESAHGHRIRSDFPDIKVNSEAGPYGTRSIYAEGNLNGGGPMLRVRTSSGDIEFRRARK